MSLSIISVCQVVALIIVSEAAIITGKVAKKGFEMSETIQSDKDKFAARYLHSLVPVTVVFQRRMVLQNTPDRPVSCQQLAFCHNSAASLFCFKEGHIVV